MATPALTLRLFATYLALLAAGFLFAPALVLPWFGFAAPRDFWIRVLGGILGILAYYYFAAARDGDRRFARRTVWGRLPLLPLYGGLVAFAGAPLPLLFVGLFESGCGVWTLLALRAEGRALPAA